MLRNDDLSCVSSFIFSILFSSCDCVSTFLSLTFGALGCALCNGLSE